MDHELSLLKAQCSNGFISLELFRGKLQKLLNGKQTWLDRHRLSSIDLQEKAALKKDDFEYLARQFHYLGELAFEEYKKCLPNTPMKQGLYSVMEGLVRASLFIIQQPDLLSRTKCQKRVNMTIIWPIFSFISVDQNTFKCFILNDRQLSEFNKKPFQSVGDLVDRLQFVESDSPPGVRIETVGSKAAKNITENVSVSLPKKRKNDGKVFTGKEVAAEDPILGSFPFRKIQLEFTDSRRGRGSVNMQKYTILVTCKASLTINDPCMSDAIPLFEPTRGIFVVSNDSEEWKADAGAFWYTAFGSQKTVLWGKFIEALGKKFLFLTDDIHGERAFTDNEREYFRDMLDPHGSGEISEHAMAVEKIQRSNGTCFSFYEWFYKICKKLNEPIIRPYWRKTEPCVLIHGFVPRKNVRPLLENSRSGTFLIRFSETQFQYPICVHAVMNQDKPGKPRQWIDISPSWLYEQLTKKSQTLDFIILYSKKVNYVYPAITPTTLSMTKLEIRQNSTPKNMAFIGFINGSDEENIPQIEGYPDKFNWMKEEAESVGSSSSAEPMDTSNISDQGAGEDPGFSCDDDGTDTPYLIPPDDPIRYLTDENKQLKEEIQRLRDEIAEMKRHA